MLLTVCWCDICILSIYGSAEVHYSVIDCLPGRYEYLVNIWEWGGTFKALMTVHQGSMPEGTHLIHKLPV